MRFKGLDLNLLVALDALLAEKSVSLAALRVHRSQPAMSASLSRLREHFQDELLVLMGNRMVLTPFAEGIADNIHDLLEQIDRAVDTGSKFDPATSNRHFTLCVADYLIEFMMPAVARKVDRLAPDVVLDIVSAGNNPSEMVENGSVDLIAVAGHATSRSFPFEIIRKEEYVIVGWKNNPILQRGGITEEEFHKMRRVTGRYGPKRNYSYAELQIQRASGRQNVALIVPSMVAIPKFLVGTNRVALLHRTLGEAYARSLPLITRPLPIQLDPFEIALQNHPTRAGDSGLEWLKAIMRESFDVKNGEYDVELALVG